MRRGEKIALAVILAAAAGPCLAAQTDEPDGAAVLERQWRSQGGQGYIRRQRDRRERHAEEESIEAERLRRMVAQARRQCQGLADPGERATCHETIDAEILKAQQERQEGELEFLEREHERGDEFLERRFRDRIRRAEIMGDDEKAEELRDSLNAALAERDERYGKREEHRKLQQGENREHRERQLGEDREFRSGQDERRRRLDEHIDKELSEREAAIRDAEDCAFQSEYGQGKRCERRVKRQLADDRRQLEGFERRAEKELRKEDRQHAREQRREGRQHRREQRGENAAFRKDLRKK